MNKYNKIIIFCLLIGLFFSLASFTFAQEKLSLNLQDAFKKETDKPLGVAAGQAGYDTTKTNALAIVSTVLNIMLSFIGVIFLISMIYGGFLWMTARGNEEHVKKAQNIIIAAVIGVIIIILAYAISWFVISRLSQNTLKSTSEQIPMGQSDILPEEEPDNLYDAD